MSFYLVYPKKGKAPRLLDRSILAVVAVESVALPEQHPFLEELFLLELQSGPKSGLYGLEIWIFSGLLHLLFQYGGVPLQPLNVQLNKVSISYLQHRLFSTAFVSGLG